jgi:hypothetical protein
MPNAVPGRGGTKADSMPEGQQEARLPSSLFASLDEDLAIPLLSWFPGTVLRTSGEGLRYVRGL